MHELDGYWRSPCQVSFSSVQEVTRHLATFESLKLTLCVSSTIAIPGTTFFSISTLLKKYPSHGKVQANKNFLSGVLSLS